MALVALLSAVMVKGRAMLMVMITAMLMIVVLAMLMRRSNPDLRRRKASSSGPA